MKIRIFLKSVMRTSGRRTMEIQGEMIGFRIEHVSEIQRHDGDAFPQPSAHHYDASPWHVPLCWIYTPSLPAPSADAVYAGTIIPPSMIHWLRLHKTFRLLQHFNRLQLQTFTLINQRTANTIKQTAHASRGLTCRKTMIYCWKSESHRAFSLLIRGRAPCRYETFERLAEEPCSKTSAHCTTAIRNSASTRY